MTVKKAFKTQLRDALHRPTTFHDVETAVWSFLKRFGHEIIRLFLDQLGSGDLGPELPRADAPPLRRLPGLHTREITTLFGTFTVDRTCYGTRGGQAIAFVPLDHRLDLPRCKASYLLQEINGLLSTSEPFAQVAAILERFLDVRQHVDTLERPGRYLARHVEPFRADQPPPPAAEEGALVVRSIDAKGVPMRRPADAPSIRAHEHKRGPKVGRKKQAIVGAVYTVDPLVRTPAEVVESLFRDPRDRPPQPRRPDPCHKRVIARLNASTGPDGVACDGLDEVCARLAAGVNDRNPKKDKTIVTLMDGDGRFPAAQKKYPLAGKRRVTILDLLHVTPRLWTAARLVAAGEEAVGAQVRAWVELVLHGRVEAVLADMRGRVAAGRRKALEAIARYLDKRKRQMRYHRYLRAGYPIASGVIEGACRHDVKDRLERTGMSWTPAGAQAMLQLRSVVLNEDWDAYQVDYRARERAALYPPSPWAERLEWPVAV